MATRVLLLVLGACVHVHGLSILRGGAQHARPSVRNQRAQVPTLLQQAPQKSELIEDVRVDDESLDVVAGAAEESSSTFSYVQFAKTYPFVNNVLIATLKTAAADLVAQAVIEGVPLASIDLERNLVFGLFGACYLGAFQYFYQVNVFKRLFPSIDDFTNKDWSDKLTDGPGLQALAAQTALDLTVLCLIYLPAFYTFKAAVFSGTVDPAAWATSGITNYQTNVEKDVVSLVRVWLPADLVCFSVPLYLRLPVRHVVSFVWTAYLSFTRGAH